MTSFSWFMLGISIALPTGGAYATPDFTLAYDVGGGELGAESSPLRVQMTVGEAVVGMGTGPQTLPKLFAENRHGSATPHSLINVPTFARGTGACA